MCYQNYYRGGVKKGKKSPDVLLGYIHSLALKKMDSCGENRTNYAQI